MGSAGVEQTVHRPPGMDDSLPPRQRILIAARDLFYRHGIQGVGVETIAEVAGTNKMTLYRHFSSKDLLVAEYLRGLAAEGDRFWDELEAAHPGDPRAQIDAWLATIGEHATHREQGGCALVNAAIQISDPDHPGRKVIEQSKRLHRERLVALCRAAGFDAPDMVAGQLFLLVEGCRVSRRSVGPDSFAPEVKALADAIMSARWPDPNQAGN